MLTRSEAEELVRGELRREETPECPFALRESATIERPFGWVFFYNSKRFIETGDVLHALAGNCPLFVNKFTGAIRVFGTSKSVRDQIEEYERELGYQ